MSKHNKSKISEDQVDLTRRRLVQALTVASAGTAAGCTTITEKLPTKPTLNPAKFDLIRAEDHFFAELEAWNMHVVSGYHGKKYLVPNCECKNAILVFEFPPQIYAETAISIEKDVSSILDSDINSDKYEKLLDQIEIVPSKKAKLVFRIPNEIRQLELSLEALLDWNRLEYLVEELEELGRVGKNKRHYLGFDWFKDEDLKYSSAIELPWGVYLQPLGKHKVNYKWRHLSKPNNINNRSELWYSSLENVYGRHLPLPFEVLDIRSLKTLEPSLGLPYRYEDAYDDKTGEGKIVECSSITNFDRLEIAGSLSRRFTYTGDPLAKPAKETDKLSYNRSLTKACYVEGQTIQVNTFGISSLGGWLDFDAEWDPKPGCGLKGWSHNTTMGRDHRVQFQRAGFLYPFGIPAELIILSEREFVKDKSKHYVAPILKRAFIQIPQPNNLILGHTETPFASLSITTVKTPPLDLPEGGNFIEYAMCDYFLPIVDGQPFKFEHLGLDHVGNQFKSSTPLYFVSNKATGSNGLIPESNNKFGKERSCEEIIESIKPRRIVNCSGSKDQPFDPKIPAKICKTKNWRKDLDKFISSKKIPCKNFPKDSGLQKLDKDWLSIDYRFAKYSSQPLALAYATSEGNTTQEVEWIEWVRGKVPDTAKDTNIASQPFLPRARTLKISLQGMSQFSGQKTYMLGTYRDLRFDEFQVLDPLPTTGDRYHENVFDAASECNLVGAYLHILPIDDVGQDRLSINDKNRLKFIRETYYYPSPGYELPESLFENINNEVSFGKQATTDAQGGIATPDAPIGILTREQGPLGDNVFDINRWTEHRAIVKENPAIGPIIVPYNRKFYIDYVRANSLNTRLYHKDISKAPAYPLCSEAQVAQLKTINIAAIAAASPESMSGLENIASMFGMDAEILPGIRLTQVLKSAGIDLGSGGASSGRQAVAFDGNPSKPVSRAPKWDYKINGLDEILALFGQGPGQISFDEAIHLFTSAPIINEPGEPLKFGVEASLDWSTDALSKVDLGIVEFKPNNAIFSVHAMASIDFLEGEPKVSAKAALTSFNIIIFKSLDVEFEQVAFSLDIHGNKNFDPQVGDIQFTGALSFINNIKSILESLGDAFGITIDLKPKEIIVGQVIALPPSTDPTEKGGSFQLGPVLISNLYIWWEIRIPLLGRGVMVISFGLARRSDPMSIFILPFYGGKAHAMMEVTTNGIRLFEVSIEFGGMIKVDYSIAKGEVSLMAGTYLGIAKRGKERTFTLSAYVKVVGEITVAGIIDFHGLILLSLSYIETSGGKQDGETIAGEATITVSMKMGFVRISYSFTAREEQTRQDNTSNKSTASVIDQNKGILDSLVDTLIPPAMADEDNCTKKPDESTLTLPVDLARKQANLFSDKKTNELWEEYYDAYA